MKKLIIVLLTSFLLFSCSEIKPLVLPQYTPPNLSSIKKPIIPIPQEGKDYKINSDNTVTYMISGQDLLTAKIISEKTAWMQIESIKQIIDIQNQIISQDQQLIIRIDLQRQYAERQKMWANVEKYAAEAIAIVTWILFLVK